MGYDISLIDKEAEQADLETLSPEELAENDSSYEVANVTVTYNYSEFLYRVLGEEKGICSIYGMTGEESIPVLESAISKLGDDVDANYFAKTEGNTKKALKELLGFAKSYPKAVWVGD